MATGANGGDDATTVIVMKDIEKHFCNVIALARVSFDVLSGECHCLLGDNGAGKSTFIKTMSRVHKPSTGTMYVEGEEILFERPRDAMAAGIATVYQDLAQLEGSLGGTVWSRRYPRRHGSSLLPTPL